MEYGLIGRDELAFGLDGGNDIGNRLQAQIVLAEGQAASFDKKTEASMAEIIGHIGGRIVVQYLGEYHSKALLLSEDPRVTSVFITTFNETQDVYLELAGRDAALLQEAGIEYLSRIPLLDQSEKDEEVRLNFWSQTRNGPAPRSRVLAVPDWKSIAHNYTADVRDKLGQLMDFEAGTIGSNGRLILWHGIPGTGKSYAIRALLYNWRSWLKGHYIVDPENFFGDANYMTTVMLSDTDNKPEWRGVEGMVMNLKKKPKPSWNLLVVEDADEFLSLDAKDRTGQAVSRLLNITDGLVGQGLNTLVLITTNEPIEAIHPAILRAGRCMADVEFDKLNPDEIVEWHAINAPDKKEFYRSPKTLAELYSSIGTGKVESRKRTGKMGFA